MSPYPSGLDWASGVNPEGDASRATRNVDVWNSFRGRPIDIVNVKGNRQGTWAELVASITSAAKANIYDAYYNAEMAYPLEPDATRAL